MVIPALHVEASMHGNQGSGLDPCTTLLKYLQNIKNGPLGLGVVRVQSLHANGHASQEALD